MSLSASISGSGGPAPPSRAQEACDSHPLSTSRLSIPLARREGKPVSPSRGSGAELAQLYEPAQTELLIRRAILRAARRGFAADRAADTAARAIAQSGDDTQRFRLLLSRGSSGNRSGPLEALHEALELARCRGDRWGECFALSAVGAWHVAHGDGLGRRELEGAQALAERMGLVQPADGQVLNLGAWCAMNGALEEAVAYALEARRRSRASGTRVFEAIAGSNLVQGYLMLDDLESATVALSDLPRDCPLPPKYETVRLTAASNVAWLQGRPDDALALLQRALSVFGPDWRRANIYGYVAAIHAEQGRAEEAREAMRRAHFACSKRDLWRYPGRMEILEAFVCRAEGRPGAAEGLVGAVPQDVLRRGLIQFLLRRYQRGVASD